MTRFFVYGRCTKSGRSFTHTINAIHHTEARAILSVREPNFEIIAINK